MRRSIFLGTFFACSLVFSQVLESDRGDNVGNGGDAVVCRHASGEITSLELLDFFEGREFRVPALVYQLGNSFQSPEKKIELALSRLNTLSPLRALEWAKEAKIFLLDALHTPHELIDIPDSMHLAFPKGCKVEQFAVRVEDPVPEEPPYLVQEELWEKAPGDHRAGIALHEVIYKEAGSYGHKNSKLARYFNSYLMADKFAAMDLRHFVDFLRRVRFEKTDIGGIWVTVESDLPQFFAEGQIQAARFVDSVIPLRLTSGDTFLAGCESGSPLKESRYIEYYPSGRIRDFTLARQTPIHLLENTFVVGSKTECPANRVWFYENGLLEKGTVSGSFDFWLQGKHVPNANAHCMEFFPTGRVRSTCVEISQATVFTKSTAVKQIVPPGVWTMVFTPDEQLLYFQKGCALPTVCGDGARH